MRFLVPGLPERNPGLKLANAFSVLPSKIAGQNEIISALWLLHRQPTRYRVVVLTSSPRSNSPIKCGPATDDLQAEVSANAEKAASSQNVKGLLFK